MLRGILLSFEALRDGTPKMNRPHLRQRDVLVLFLVKCVVGLPPGSLTSRRFVLLVRWCGLGNGYSPPIPRPNRRLKIMPAKNEQKRYHMNTFSWYGSDPSQGRKATTVPGSMAAGRSTYHISMRGMNHRNEVFIDCHIIFDCSCMMCFSCFFSLAMSFLSPARAAFIDSDLHWLISLFQSLNWSRLVRSRLVVDVANETPKATSMMKNVEFGVLINQSIVTAFTLRRSVEVQDTFLRRVLALRSDSTDKVYPLTGVHPCLFRRRRRNLPLKRLSLRWRRRVS